jgi:hypothetical protein
MSRVLLNKDHTDAGKDYRAGDEIEVDDSTAGWLKENGIASEIKTKAPAAAKKDAE